MFASVVSGVCAGAHTGEWQRYGPKLVGRRWGARPSCRASVVRRLGPDDPDSFVHYISWAQATLRSVPRPPAGTVSRCGSSDRASQWLS